MVRYIRTLQYSAASTRTGTHHHAPITLHMHSTSCILHPPCTDPASILHPPCALAALFLNFQPLAQVINFSVRCRRSFYGWDKLRAAQRCCSGNPYWNRWQPVLEPVATRIGTGSNPCWHRLQSVHSTVATRVDTNDSMCWQRWQPVLVLMKIRVCNGDNQL